MNVSLPLLSWPQGPLPPGDLLPHDVEDGGAHEAVLDGAREQEGGATLQQLVQGLELMFDLDSGLWLLEPRAELIRAHC